MDGRYALSYTGQAVTQLFLDRWRSGLHVGAAKPNLTVQVRRGEFRRGYRRWTGAPMGAHVAGRAGAPDWYPVWTPLDAYDCLTGVKDVRVEQSYDNNGVATLKVELDNVIYEERAGAVGAFHQILRGFYAPLRGYTGFGRPQASVPQNAWFLHLPNAQITVLAGYGDQQVPIFTGLVDDLDMEAKPSTMVITSRDFGGALVDQFFYGGVNDPALKNPITFIPHDEADQLSQVGYGPYASSWDPGHPPSSGRDSSLRSYWESQAHHDENHIEWYQVKIPAGRYRSFYLNMPWAGARIFASLYVRPIGAKKLTHAYWHGDDGSVIQINDTNMQIRGWEHGDLSLNPGNYIPVGWLDLAGGTNFFADASDPLGGWPFIARQDNFPNHGRTVPWGTRDFSGEIILGANSVLRIGFQKLPKTGEILRNGPFVGQKVHRAGVRALHALKRTENPDVVKHRWIVVDDVADMVKWAVRAGGFSRDWEIEDTGVNLKDRKVVNQGTSLMDLINSVKNQVGYTFFIAEPDPTDDLSIGVPIFRLNRSFAGPESGVVADQVTEKDMLTEARIHWSNEKERTLIKARGKTVGHGEGGHSDGDDSALRRQFTYIPPWARRMAGVIKPFVAYNNEWTSTDDCQLATHLISLQIALAQLTGTIDIPGTPHIGLDSQVSVIDSQTGLNMRLYVSNRNIHFHRDTKTQFTTELGGGFLDTPDFLVCALDFLNAKHIVDPVPPKAKKRIHHTSKKMPAKKR